MEQFIQSPPSSGGNSQEPQDRYTCRWFSQRLQKSIIFERQFKGCSRRVLAKRTQPQVHIDQLLGVRISAIAKPQLECDSSEHDSSEHESSEHDSSEYACR